MGFLVPIGLALSAAGTGLGIAGARSSGRAMNRAITSQLQKQEQFQRLATPIYEESFRQATPQAARQQIAGGADMAQALYSRLNGPSAVSALPVSDTDMALIRDSVGQRRQASASLQGLQNFLQTQQLRNQEAQTGLSAIGGLSRASAQNSPFLTQLAGQSGAGLSSIGSLFSTAGTLAGVFGAMQPAGGGSIKPGKPNPPGYNPWTGQD